MHGFAWRARFNKSQSARKLNVGILFQTHLLATEYINMGEKYSLTVLMLIVSVAYFAEGHFLREVFFGTNQLKVKCCQQWLSKVACTLHLLRSFAKTALYVGHELIWNGMVYFGPHKRKVDSLSIKVILWFCTPHHLTTGKQAPMNLVFHYLAKYIYN